MSDDQHLDGHDTSDEDDVPRCGAKNRQHTGYCTLPAGWGTQHQGFGRCRKHGGNTPTQVKQVTEVKLKAEANDLLKSLGEAKPIENPLRKLQELAGEAERWKNALQVMVGDLQATALRYSTETEQIDGRVVLYERALDRVAKILIDIAKLNLDERIVRIEERQGALIAQVLLAALKAAGVSLEQEQVVTRVVWERLRELGAGE